MKLQTFTTKVGIEPNIKQGLGNHYFEAPSLLYLQGIVISLILPGLFCDKLNLVLADPCRDQI